MTDCPPLVVWLGKASQTGFDCTGILLVTNEFIFIGFETFGLNIGIAEFGRLCKGSC